ncbi:MAG: nucleotidyltransferase domain-containing protein [bacterium]|nr:nucleotidyltransferase domain-containing protein [bacterium]
MNKTHIQILKEITREKKKYFDNYMDFVREIKKEAGRILRNVRVIVFGSVVKKNHTPLSDIDVLIICDELPDNWEERRMLRAKIKPPFSPFQIHLVTDKEFLNSYKNFIKDDYIEV